MLPIACESSQQCSNCLQTIFLNENLTKQERGQYSRLHIYIYTKAGKHRATKQCENSDRKDINIE